MTPEQVADARVYERAFARLAEKDLVCARTAARASQSEAAKELTSVIERARTVHARALAKLGEAPPQEPVRLEWKQTVVRGKIVRIDGKRVWIAMDRMENPVDLSALPSRLLVAALALDPDRDESHLEHAELLLALGELDEAVAAAKRAGGEACRRRGRAAAPTGDAAS
jgi:hypothetical protein